MKKKCFNQISILGIPFNRKISNEFNVGELVSAKISFLYLPEQGGWRREEGEESRAQGTQGEEVQREGQLREGESRDHKFQNSVFLISYVLAFSGTKLT